MDQKTFSVVAGVIFTLVALFHLVRIYMGWPVDIGDWSVPMWELMQVDLFAGGARICRTWNFAALGGEYARADVAESLGHPAGRKRGSHELETKARLHCDETGRFRCKSR